MIYADEESITQHHMGKKIISVFLFYVYEIVGVICILADLLEIFIMWSPGHSSGDHMIVVSILNQRKKKKRSVISSLFSTKCLVFDH